MPYPIKPVHELTQHNEIFGKYKQEELSLSELQSFLLQDNNNKVVTSNKNNIEYVGKLLEEIEKNENELLNTAIAATNIKSNNKYYYIPKHINENDILLLKTSGYISGNGREVTITTKGKNLLRDYWLNEKNNLDKNRKKQKFNFPVRGK